MSSDNVESLLCEVVVFKVDDLFMCMVLLIGYLMDMFECDEEQFIKDLEQQKILWKNMSNKIVVFENLGFGVKVVLFVFQKCFIRIDW